MKREQCNMDCLNCVFQDCINESPATLSERRFSVQFENSVKKETQPQIIPELGMQRYIHNRPDKEAYEKARNAEYDRKRDPVKRKEQKRQQYKRHREDKIAYQKRYYEEHKEEVLAQSRAKYLEHKEEINAKRRAKYLETHPRKPKQTPEERKEKARQYREAHREEINRKKREAYYKRKELLQSVNSQVQ